MWRCRVFGHRYRFGASGPLMTWTCARHCGAGGSKRYRSAEEARRYAAAFDREDRADLGRRAPLVGLLPLRVYRLLRRRRAARAERGVAGAGDRRAGGRGSTVEAAPPG